LTPWPGPFISTSCRLLFSYEILTPAALNFFVSYADGAVESLWSIDQYFEFVLVLMLSTGLSFQVGKDR
jgi:sec-independent protein translocase protein TatC